MAQLVPLNKRSKKAQKEYHAKRRGSWYGLDPVTRTVPSGKVYDRLNEQLAALLEKPEKRPGRPRRTGRQYPTQEGAGLSMSFPKRKRLPQGVRLLADAVLSLWKLKICTSHPLPK